MLYENAQSGLKSLNGRSIGTPKLDNIVRSEARRLRRKLEAYAASNDPDETVRITMPTGGYGVQFEELARKPIFSDVPPASVTEFPPPPSPLSSENGGKLSAEPARRRPTWWSVSIGCLLCLLCIVLFRSWRSRSRENGYEIEPFSSEMGLQFSPSISSDGKNDCLRLGRRQRSIRCIQQISGFSRNASPHTGCAPKHSSRLVARWEAVGIPSGSGNRASIEQRGSRGSAHCARHGYASRETDPSNARFSKHVGCQQSIGRLPNTFRGVPMAIK